MTTDKGIVEVFTFPLSATEESSLPLGVSDKSVDCNHIQINFNIVLNVFAYLIYAGILTYTYVTSALSTQSLAAHCIIMTLKDGTQMRQHAGNTVIV